MTDLRQQTHAVVDLLGKPPWGPLYQALVGEAQHDPGVAAALNERFIRPQTEKDRRPPQGGQGTGAGLGRLRSRTGHGDPARPLYFTFLITQEPVTHDCVDRVCQALFDGMGP